MKLNDNMMWVHGDCGIEHSLKSEAEECAEERLAEACAFKFTLGDGFSNLSGSEKLESEAENNNLSFIDIEAMDAEGFTLRVINPVADSESSDPTASDFDKPGDGYKIYPNPEIPKSEAFGVGSLKRPIRISTSKQENSHSFNWGISAKRPGDYQQSPADYDQTLSPSRIVEVSVDFGASSHDYTAFRYSSTLRLDAEFLSKYEKEIQAEMEKIQTMVEDALANLKAKIWGL